MARPKKKENKPVTIRMDQEVYDRLDRYCERSGQTKTTAIERSIEFFIDDYDRKMSLIAEAEK